MMRVDRRDAKRFIHLAAALLINVSAKVTHIWGEGNCKKKLETCTFGKLLSIHGTTLHSVLDTLF